MAGHHRRDVDELARGAFAWVSDDSETNTAVVFVHGFFGDARGTWLNFPGMIDSHVTAESFWHTSDLFFLEYPSYDRHIADNADGLLRFLAHVFPNPPPSLFRPRSLAPRSKHLVELVLRWEQLQPRVYQHLLLVGHSEGAVVIRQAMIDACQRTKGKDTLLGAHLALFAPAHRGVLVTGWVRAVMEVAGAERLLELSPAFVEMKDEDFINGVERNTDALLAKHGLPGLTARALFGCDEDLVRVQVYSNDVREECAPNEGHRSVCKPRGGYLTPFAFIERVFA
jgi:pimeloyl-ACP methyl ester carboxylesterase